MPTVTELYQQRLAESGIQPDPAQAAAVVALQRVYDDLLRKKGLFCWSRSVKGLYLWGQVGRGKTFLMDLFFASLPFKDKMRAHFHVFMKKVHASLREHDGKKNPLTIVAKELAAQARVICFDEFVVEDIADAMLLGNLLEALFDEDVCLVATSNVVPHRLYLNGLQRQQFLPAIALIESNTEIMELEHATDYRRQHVLEEGLYYTPLDDVASDHMNKEFKYLSKGELHENKAITVEGRSIQTVKYTDDSVWFEFDAICHIPRSQSDYLALVARYKNFFISNIPQLKCNQDDITRNFINLIDVLYDARKNFIASAAVPIEQLYVEGRYAFEFQRIVSRLIEMQSLTYVQDYNVI